MNPTALVKLLLWLAAVGAVVLIASRVLGATTRKAATNLPG